MAPKSSKTTKPRSNVKSAPHIDPNSSFTPESFEKELKALAAKAKDETWLNTAREQAPLYLKAAVLIALVAISCSVSQLNLSPIYGSIPSSIYHSKLVNAAAFVGWSVNRRLPWKSHLWLPVIAAYIPMVQFFLSKASGTLTATWGPLTTELLTLFPLAVLSVARTATYLEDLDLSSLPSWIRDAAPGMGSYAFLALVSNLSSSLLDQSIGKTILITRLGLQLLLTASYTLLFPSKLLLFALPALLHTSLLNTHAPTPWALSSLNSTLQSHNYALLARKESLTGYISVLENLDVGFRVLRCDHSLLGGEWTKLVATHPHLKDNLVAEPIYGVFAMLEAVRLVKVPDPVPDKDAEALVIGMGIGTTPAALVAHGIGTTVVEIDPVVAEFAGEWFRLPSGSPKLRVVVQDAVSFSARTVEQGGQFDYVVHDVFTGGAEPIPLFTLEFLQNLAALLKPNGVIAINYAGDFALPPPAVVVRTVREVFPSCRIFREHPRDEEVLRQGGGDFTNMVIFCTKLTTGIEFREARSRDLLNSPSREQFLVPRHEVRDEDFLVGMEEGVLRTGDTGKLERWHRQSALGHWKVMRSVLPEVVWQEW